jgi:hypothetical protein
MKEVNLEHLTDFALLILPNLKEKYGKARRQTELRILMISKRPK